MSAAESRSSRIPFLQLPHEVLREVIRKLDSGDQQTLTHACKQARSIVAASAVTQLSISQHAMVPLPTNLAPIPSAFTAVQHLTLDLTGNMLDHTLPFLQSFQQHCSSILSGVTSLTLKLTPLSGQVKTQLAQLLGSCCRLSLLKLESPSRKMYITLREQSPGARLCHLSQCFLHGSPDLCWHVLVNAVCTQHVTGFSFINPIDNHAFHGMWFDLPSLQELSSFLPLGTSQAQAQLQALTCLTRLHLGIFHRDMDNLQQLLQQTIPSMVLLKDLSLDGTMRMNESLPILPASWSSLQQLSQLEKLCLAGCELGPSVTLTSLVGLNHLQLLGIKQADPSPDHSAFFPSHLTCLHVQMADSNNPYADGSDDDSCLWLARMSTLSGTLRTLILECSTMPASCAGRIAKLTSLQKLELSVSLPSRSHPSVCPQDLACMTQLTSLSMKDSRWELANKCREHDLTGMTRLQQLHLDGSPVYFVSDGCAQQPHLPHIVPFNECRMFCDVSA